MPEIRSTKSIAVQAVEAYQAGQGINANPFPFDSEAHTVWRRVFQQAQQDLGGLSADRMVMPAGAMHLEAAQA